VADFPSGLLLKNEVKREQIWDVTTVFSRSGKRSAATWQTAARYRWTISIARLALDVSGNEFATLATFVAAQKGTYAPFNFTCPLDGTQRNCAFEDPGAVSRIVSRIFDTDSITIVSVL
jgi:hypothetical protein